MPKLSGSSRSVAVQNPIRNSGHGGTRQGAGRPRKWSFDDVLTVGQACEVAWRGAVANAFEAAELKLFRMDSDIQSLWDTAQGVPVEQRKQWYASEKGKTHHADIKIELHALNGTPDDPDPPSRGIRITAKPPRGTRKRIIAETAKQFGLPDSAVDALWQEYRRFEREQQSYRIPPNLDF